MLVKGLLPLLMTAVLTILQSAYAKPVLDLQRWQTSNGSNVYFVAVPDLPMLNLSLTFDAGSARDDKHPGIAQLTNNLLDQGTSRLSADQVADNFDDIGAQYSADVDRDMASVKLRTLSEDKYLIPALATFEQVIAHPSFNTNEFDREKKSQLEGIALKQQRPDSLASDAFYKTIYREHPYAHPVLGDANSVRGIDLKNIREFYKKYYTAKNLLIVMVGAIDRKQAENIAERLSKSLPVGEKANPLPLANMTQSGEHSHISLPIGQTTVLLGHVGVNREDKDYFPLYIGNYTLGSGTFVSRLYQQVREQRGLSYSVSSRILPLAARGPFLIGLATRNTQAQQALTLCQDIVKKFVNEGPTEMEVAAAKKNITGGYTLNLDSNGAIASVLAVMGFYKLPDDYFDTFPSKINAVSIQQIREAIHAHIQPNQMSIITVGSYKLADSRYHAKVT